MKLLAGWSARFRDSVGFVRDTVKRAGQKLLEAEEGILEKSHAGELRRENAEADVWGTESENWASAPEPAGRFFNVKIFAFLGGATMAGLILLGLSLAHRSSAPLTMRSEENSAASNASQPAERPAVSSQSAKPLREPAVATKAVKPSPSKSVQIAGNSPTVRPRIRRPAHGAAEDDQEVITRYYKRNSPRVRASSDGVKHYSDMN